MREYLSWLIFLEGGLSVRPSGNGAGRDSEPDRIATALTTVIPAKAEIQTESINSGHYEYSELLFWIPAFAGMTAGEVFSKTPRSKPEKSGLKVRPPRQTKALYFACCFFLLFLSGLSFAYEPKVSVEVSPREITVGDPVELLLNLKTDPTDKVSFPGNEAFAPAEIIKVDTISSKKGEWSLRYVLSLFEPGDKDLPVLPVVVQSSGRSDTLWVEPGNIKVKSVLAPEDSASGLKDIKPPLPMRWTFKDMLPWLIGLLILILAIIVWRRVRLKLKRARGEIPAYIPPPRPAHLVALERLEKLKADGLPDKETVLPFYSLLSEILKEYIGRRFNIDALEMTTTELLGNDHIWSISRENRSHIVKIVTMSDLVKFARYKPERGDHIELLEAGFIYVRATKPDDAGLPNAGDTTAMSASKKEAAQ